MMAAKVAALGHFDGAVALFRLVVLIKSRPMMRSSFYHGFVALFGAYRNQHLEADVPHGSGAAMMRR